MRKVTSNFGLFALVFLVAGWQARAEFVILSVTRDSDEGLVRHRQFLRSEGYSLCERFDGALYWKSSVLEGDFYELYRADAGPPAISAAPHSIER
jgi:hypothetical protein